MEIRISLLRDVLLFCLPSHGKHDPSCLETCEDKSWYTIQTHSHRRGNFASRQLALKPKNPSRIKRDSKVVYLSSYLIYIGEPEHCSCWLIHGLRKFIRSNEEEFLTSP